MNSNHDPPPLGLDAWGLDRMMDIHELAAYLGVPVSTVYDWRTHGKGPTAYRAAPSGRIRNVRRPIGVSLAYLVCFDMLSKSRYGG